ncbi:MAG TPA: SIS domain-containing protein [Phycisphaerales bacterium]|mgnify:CR=1 FL=1|nr:SIS domain-containing protein [Phycisphaerales bacterium]HMP38113.1 SIS domain-containing protein [Phycisphaerales bacterium]
MNPTTELIKRRIAGSIAALEALRRDAATIAACIDALVGTIRAGGLIATCGNGGSAAEALHLSEELLGRYRSARSGLRSACLAADPTALTCIANDFGFEEVFARQARALLRPGDALVAFSTSGRSPNILRALEAARALGAMTVGFLGGDGGPAHALCDHAVVVPVADSAHVQEAHQVLLHLLCEALEPIEPGAPVGPGSPLRPVGAACSAPMDAPPIAATRPPSGGATE